MHLLPERTGGAHEQGTRKRRRKRTHWRDLETRDAEGEFGGFFCLIQVFLVPSGAVINLDASLSSMSRARAKSRLVSPPSLWVISRSVTRL